MLILLVGEAVGRGVYWLVSRGGIWCSSMLEIVLVVFLSDLV